MSDLREQVARAMHPLTWKHHDRGGTYEGLRERIAESLIDADEVIAVAEPLIRAQVIEELIAEGGNSYLQTGETLADWLRSQDGTAPHE